MEVSVFVNLHGNVDQYILNMIFEWVGIIVCAWIATFLFMTLMCDCDMQLAFYEKFGKSPDSLKGKVVFITGASSGIGEHTAYALAKSGVSLALTARRGNDLLRVKRKCLELSAGRLRNNDILVIAADITEFWRFEELLDRVLETFGTIDIILNNAGRSQRARFEDIEFEVDQELFNLNVFSAVYLTRLAINHFNDRGQGHVAVVSSIAGILGFPNSATYTASKHALHGYYNCLRTERMGTNIDVTILCPGPTFTNILKESFTDEITEKYNIPQKLTDNCMSAERCGYLIAVALANKTAESWIVKPPLLTVTYLWFYFPSLFLWAMNSKAGRNWIFKKRNNQ